jgi:hypothetical protein
MGFGSDPAAGSGAGIGVLVSSPALAAAGYQRSTTGAVSSVNIDGSIRDVTLDAYGNEEGMSDAAQCVQIAFGTRVGEIAVDHEAGVRWPTKLGDTVLSQMRAEASRVMAPLTSSGIAELVDVFVEVEGTTLYGLVTWRDMRTNTEQQIKLPIGG